ANDYILNKTDKLLQVVRTEELVSHAVDRMRVNNISQLPVIDKDGFVGSLNDSNLISALLSNRDVANMPIKELMDKPYPIVSFNEKATQVTSLLSQGNNAVLVQLENGKYQIITKHDIVNSIQ